MAIRLQDIANDLNLSTMTISKVLRGQTDVSAETKARVLKRVQELNYRPNVSARSLRTGQTYSVGMVLPTLSGQSVPAIVLGVSEVFRGAEYALVLASADGDQDAEEREAELHLSRQVDALLFCLREAASDIPSALKNTSTPVVLLGNRPPRVSALAVGHAELEIGRIATKHLLERRCRRIAYLRGPRTAVADLRFAGFREAMREAAIAVRQDWIVEMQPREQDYRSGFETVAKLLADRPKPEGVIAYTDLLALGARDAALAAGLAVPEQMQVIGCGNDVAICEVGIGVSSVDLCSVEIGRKAARMALKMIEKREATSLRSVNVAPSVVQRASTRLMGIV